MVGLNRGSGGDLTPISGKWGQNPLIPLMHRFTGGLWPHLLEIGV